jgi:hypothetical protein
VMRNAILRKPLVVTLKLVIALALAFFWFHRCGWSETMKIDESLKKNILCCKLYKYVLWIYNVTMCICT